MDISYVLIQCDLGHEIEIIRTLETIPEIKEVRGTLGVFDIFVKMQCDSKEQSEGIVTKIRSIPNIRGTNTLTAILSQGGR